MKKIKFNFQNCYGIKNLLEELTFSNKKFANYVSLKFSRPTINLILLKMKNNKPLKLKKYEFTKS